MPSAKTRIVIGILVAAIVLASAFAMVLMIRNPLATQIAEVPPVEISSVVLGPAAGPCPDANGWRVISMPAAGYTSQAKQRGTKGTVELFGYFEFNGNVAITHVTSGLGHGLDQSSVKAAKQIKFTPTIQCSRFLSEPVRIIYEFPGGKGTAIHL